MRSLHLLLGCLLLVGLPRPADPATIAIDADKDLVPVNPSLFGTNLQANDHSGEPIKAFIRDSSTYRSVTQAPAVTVRITESVFNAAGPTFRHTFPDHSITVIELLARQEGK